VRVQNLIHLQRNVESRSVLPDCAHSDVKFQIVLIHICPLCVQTIPFRDAHFQL
jgi:hypothetical protein